MKICLVCSHGGHFDQMLQIVDAFNDCDYFFVTYYSGSTKNLKNSYFLKYKGWGLKGKLSFILTIFYAINILLKEKPDVIISTGGGEIAIPFCYVGKILRKKVVFIETLARVTTPSNGGKIIYPIADLFLVQWKTLLRKYGKKAKYWGKVI